MELRRLILVRHGETDGQSSIRYHGITDVSLSDVGRRQMRQVGAALAGEIFDAVYTSALRRTVDAATLVAPAHVPRIVPEFNEINFGDWEGLTREEIAARDPERFEQWSRDGQAFSYPGGDSVGAFRQHVVDAWRRLSAIAPARLLIIAHKGVIASVLTDLLQLSAAQRAAWPIDLGSIHVLVRAAAEWRSERVNAIGHLEDPA
jgi:broad specificity phosphatase PhoE